MTDATSTADYAELAVLTCGACGSPVALTDGEVAHCGHCGARVSVPAAHRARHLELRKARTDRKRAEKLLSTLPQPLPRWVVVLGPWVVSIGLLAWSVVAIIAWVFWGWFPTPLHMLGWGIFTPVFITIFALIDLMAARSYDLKMAALTARHEDNGWLCRRCGAPLCLEIDALAATCDYCESDNLIRDAGPLFRRALERERRSASRSLGAAFQTLREQRRNLRTVRIVVAAVLIPVWLFFVGPSLWALLTG